VSGAAVAVREKAPPGGRVRFPPNWGVQGRGLLRLQYVDSGRPLCAYIVEKLGNWATAKISLSRAARYLRR